MGVKGGVCKNHDLAKGCVKIDYSRYDFRSNLKKSLLSCWRQLWECRINEMVCVNRFTIRKICFLPLVHLSVVSRPTPTRCCVGEDTLNVHVEQLFYSLWFNWIISKRNFNLGRAPLTPAILTPLLRHFGSLTLLAQQGGSWLIDCSRYAIPHGDRTSKIGSRTTRISGGGIFISTHWIATIVSRGNKGGDEMGCEIS